MQCITAFIAYADFRCDMGRLLTDEQHSNEPKQNVAPAAPLARFDGAQVLTVSVEEGEDVAGGRRGAQQPGGDKALPLPLTHDPHGTQLLQVIIQLILQAL